MTAPASRRMTRSKWGAVCCRIRWLDASARRSANSERARKCVHLRHRYLSCIHSLDVSKLLPHHPTVLLLLRRWCMSRLLLSLRLHRPLSHRSYRPPSLPPSCMPSRHQRGRVSRSRAAQSAWKMSTLTPLAQRCAFHSCVVTASMHGACFALHSPIRHLANGVRFVAKLPMAAAMWLMLLAHLYPPL